MDAGDSKSLLREISKEYFTISPQAHGQEKNLELKHKPSPSLFYESISFSCNSEISLAESLKIKFPEWIEILGVFEDVEKEYNKRKKQNKFLDFDDLLLNWKKLTLNPKVLKKFSKKWDYVLVDEYQDTNLIQADIVFNISKEHQNILVVGDDAQSIYSFRAANIKNILDFPKVFKKCQVHKLESNYRSSSEIVSLANEVIKDNQYQFSKNLKAIQGGFIKPILVALKTNREEANFIADKIEEALEDGMKASEIAVLFRAASHSQYLEMELNKRGILYELRGGFRFFERAHIKDALAYLRIINNFKDEISWTRALSQFEGIGLVSIKKIYNLVLKSASLEEVLNLEINLKGKASCSWGEFKAILKTLIKNKNISPEKLLRLVTDFYYPYLKAEYTDYKYRKEDLNQLAFFAINYGDLKLFLSEVALQESFILKDKRDKRERIILSTVHQAKGLEWEIVFVINLTNQGFPHPLCVEKEDYEEERRLFYVAITRAKKYLYLIYPAMAYRYGEYKNLEPSDFIKDLNEDLLNYNELAHRNKILSNDQIQYINIENE